MSIKWLIIILKKKFSIFPKERSRLYKNQFRNSLQFVLFKDRSRSEDWLWSIIKIYFLYSYAIKCQSFKQSHLSRVSEIWLVHRSTFICETPGYHHLDAASNAVTRDYFSHNATIWSNKIPYFIYKIWTKHIIKKWKTVSCSWENFWFFPTKNFFFDFFMICSKFSIKSILTLS